MARGSVVTAFLAALVASSAAAQHQTAGDDAGRKLQQMEPVAPTASAILGTPLAEQLIGRKLQQAEVAAPYLMAAPLAESLLASAGMGRKLQQASELGAIALPAPLAETMVKPVGGLGRRLEQAWPGQAGRVKPGPGQTGRVKAGPGKVLEFFPAPIAEVLPPQRTIGRKLQRDVETMEIGVTPSLFAPAAEVLATVPVGGATPATGRKLQQATTEAAAPVLVFAPVPELPLMGRRLNQAGAALPAYQEIAFASQLAPEAEVLGPSP